MKKKQGRPKGLLHTLSRQASCLDPFSKLDAFFLEKVFRYNLADHFSDALLSLEDVLPLRKIRSKHLKQLSSLCFIAQSPLSISKLTQRIDSFYRQGWQAQDPGFKHLYGNGLSGQQGDISAEEIVMVQVRVRAEIERIENLPLEIYRELETYQQLVLPQAKDEEAVLGHFRAYKKRTITLFIVYYGDINFHLFDKFHYCPRGISFFGNNLLVKIHVFYISRLALLNKFRMLNRIENIDHINDLLFQLYEVRREKLRARKARKIIMMKETMGEMEKGKIAINALKWLAIVSVTGVSLGALFLKYFL